ncbi:hypothetical protein R3P38DRAFT_2507537 [Favolaschia claudopus]|uniref:Ubiquitin-like protease family profile domain-containing protein n=1 Tax=Favolaschia claudopus TaxID=2862362 RepID=A0AAW0D8J8_9AGAR
MTKYAKRSIRAYQPAAVSGLGTHHKSPIKARDTRKKRIVNGSGRARDATAAAQRLAAILRGGPGGDPPSTSPPSLDPPSDFHDDMDVDIDDCIEEEPPVYATSATLRSAPPRPPLAQQSDSDAAHKRLNDAWNNLLPLLEMPWVQYLRDTHGRRRDCIPNEVLHHCTSSCESLSVVSKIRCLYPTHIQHVTLKTCSCKSAAVLLVEQGVFPASPSKPQTGISLDLLDFYRAMFERSCDAVTALAAALHTVYERRGFRVLSQRPIRGDGVHNPVQDPFRRLLTQAVQWSSNLRARVECKVDAALQAAATQRRTSSALTTSITTSATPVEASAATESTSATPVEASAATESTSATPIEASAATASTSAIPIEASAATESTSAATESTSATPIEASARPPSQAPPALSPGHAHRTLVERCPACFGLTEWGRSLKDGGDVQGGADGCFNYLRLKSAGNGPISYNPKYFLSKEKTDAAGRKILVARKNPKANPNSLVAKEVVAMCEESWDAANEKKKKANPERYDASGIFVMTCRHGQPIFLCNIDTPGEQQRYIVAMVEELFTMLPKQATLMQAYDVACVTDHSLDLYPIVSESIRSRISFVINGMHAYGHQWACQLVYNPRFRTGMGLADHEGVERFWSRTRKLIPLTRTQWSSRRIWMIDQYAAFVGEEGRASLGAWISRQHDKNIVVKHRSATKTFRECRVTERVVRAEWAAQKEAQTSIRAHAPQRLRRELDKVLSLQTQIDAVEKAIEDTKKTLKGAGAPTSSLKILQGLELTHEKLSTEAEALYGSLNIHDTYPELRGLPLEFTQTLLVMRDLKINIRKRATGSFMEWETLDRAVSGRREPLGTKLHQTTRKAISKRAPALLKAINKFNAGCETLAKLRPPDCSIPFPSPLSTQLTGLRNDPTLHEDVWITPSQGPIPRWLNDDDVRDAIRSLHVLDRCAEEVVRLNLERDNLRHWLSEEVAVVEQAKQALGDSPLVFFILQRQQNLADMERSWSPFLRHLDIEGRVISRRINAASAASTTAFKTSMTSRTTSAASASTSGARLSGDRLHGPDYQEPSPSGPHSFFDAEDEFLEFGGGELDLPLDPGDSSDEDQVELVEHLIGQVLDNSDDEEECETSALEASTDVLDVRWTYEISTGTSIDMTFPHELAERNSNLETTDEHFSHYVVLEDGRTLEITPDDYKPFANPHVFRTPYSPTSASANRCAVFSTYDLGLVQHKGSDPDLWRRISPTQYWDKPIWLIPVHRPHQRHWVLVVVLIPAQKLLFFDSLASASGWRQDLRDVMLLITRLVALANRNSHALHVTTEDPMEKWEAHPLFTPGHPRQTNDYDCGIWVLSMMAAFMRGHSETRLIESDIPWVRDVFRKHILSLPFT